MFSNNTFPLDSWIFVLQIHNGFFPGRIFSCPRFLIYISIDILKDYWMKSPHFKGNIPFSMKKLYKIVAFLHK